MTTNITGATGPTAFSDPVVAPADGEAASASSVQVALQDLADRDEYLKERVETLQSYCYATVTASGLMVAEEDFTLAIDTQSGGFTVSSGDIVLPNDGTYEYSYTLHVTDTSTSNPTMAIVNAEVDGTDLSSTPGTRHSASAGAVFQLIGGPEVFTASAGNVFVIELDTTGSGLSTSGSYTSHLVIRQIA